METTPYTQALTAAADAGFVSASLTGAVRGGSPPAERITVRPVDLAGGRRLQFTSVSGGRTDVVNLPPDDAADRLADLVTSGFATILIKTLDADLQVVHSRKGIPRLIRHRPSSTLIDTAHDRTKARLLDQDAPFLAACGITDQHGRIKPSARAKHRQVERFVEILHHTLPDDLAAGTPLTAVDFGCGAGVLTLAAYHYLHHVRGLDVAMTGVDTKADLIARLLTTAEPLGWNGLQFVTSTIETYQPNPDQRTPDLVIALHACDTATDDALARAVAWQASWILAAPCCQHHLQAQLDRRNTRPAAAPLLRHGIVRERLGDLLTDSLRAEILRAHGYRTDVIEFVSTEHTGKNLMIRAARAGSSLPSGSQTTAHAARMLADEWGVMPALAERIGYGPPGSADTGLDAGNQLVGSGDPGPAVDDHPVVDQHDVGVRRQPER